ncbi:MAG: family 1 glycosylhydrolase [Spiroplasma phoeniceum]|nr:MAG: family 1 glycosylhydrolase [Spiroplasma phoeniceum]UZQ31844.1 MAG: family 1 glycosylhydrolase [Spiroplasma phoeniceum]
MICLQLIVFLDSMVKNFYPQELKEVAKKYNFMRQIADADEELIQDENLKIDFLGVNFYQPAWVKGVDFIPDFTNGAITPHYF